MKKKNFHTHTTFCDGKSTAEEMVLSAIDKGFETLGFSGHSYESYDESWCMSKEDTAEYIKEIHRLKDKYSDKIKIYCGIELDSFSDIDTTDFDYVIASVHTMLKNGVYYTVDGNEEGFLKGLNEGYGGDYLSYAKDYFESVANQNGDILGHIDLMSKFNEGNRIFDENNPLYLSYAEEAIKRIVSKNMLFEINTGAISRGYRSTPYPSENILRLIKKHGGKVTVNSDCHHADSIDCAYEDAYRLAKECGFEEIFYLF